MIEYTRVDYVIYSLKSFYYVFNIRLNKFILKKHFYLVANNVLILIINYFSKTKIYCKRDSLPFKIIKIDTFFLDNFISS